MFVSSQDEVLDRKPAVLILVERFPIYNLLAGAESLSNETLFPSMKAATQTNKQTNNHSVRCAAANFTTECRRVLFLRYVLRQNPSLSRRILSFILLEYCYSITTLS